MWPTGKWNSRIRVVREGTDKAIPSYLTVVMSPYPTWLFPKSQDCPLGTDGASSHWSGSGYKGRKGSSGKGAFSRSTRCSRSIQHCGVWRGKCEVTSAGNLPPSYLLLVLPSPPHFPISIHLDPCQGATQCSIFFTCGQTRNLFRKQSCSPTSCLSLEPDPGFHTCASCLSFPALGQAPKC